MAGIWRLIVTGTISIILYDTVRRQLIPFSSCIKTNGDTRSLLPRYLATNYDSPKSKTSIKPEEVVTTMDKLRSSYSNVANNHPQRKTSTKSSKFEKVWPRLKQTLCPNMIPNVSLSKSRLFHMARKRLEMDPNYEQYIKSQQTDDHVYQTFFEWYVAVNVYLPPSRSKTDPNDRAAMIYVPVWKCANDQIRYGTAKSLGEDYFDAVGVHRFDRFFGEFLPGKATAAPPCVVTALRDPISHFLSGHNEVDTRYEDPRTKVDREAAFESLVFTRYRHGSRRRFEQFVVDFLSGPIIEVVKSPFNTHPLKLPHIYLMSGILVELAKVNVTLTNYLTSLHNLTWHWPEFVVSSCPDVDFPEGFGTQQPLQLEDQKTSSKDLKGDYDAAKRVWSEGGITAQVLCILHVMDYACFDKFEIPLLCRDVYTEDEFLSALTSDNEEVDPAK